MPNTGRCCPFFAAKLLAESESEFCVVISEKTALRKLYAGLFPSRFEHLLVENHSITGAICFGFPSLYGFLTFQFPYTFTRSKTK